MDMIKNIVPKIFICPLNIIEVGTGSDFRIQESNVNLKQKSFNTDTILKHTILLFWLCNIMYYFIMKSLKITKF